MSKGGGLSQRNGLPSDTDALQLDDPVRLSGFPKRRRGDVINRNARRSSSIENTVVGMTVKNRVYAESVDWLFQSAGTEEGKNFRVFSLQGRADGRVMQDSNAALGL